MTIMEEPLTRPFALAPAQGRLGARDRLHRIAYLVVESLGPDPDAEIFENFHLGADHTFSVVS